jgi:hypothetical protein
MDPEGMEMEYDGQGMEYGDQMDEMEMM